MLHRRSLKNSHNYHKWAAETFNMTDKADWIKLTPEMYEKYVEEKDVFKNVLNVPKEVLYCGIADWFIVEKSLIKGELIKIRGILYMYV